MNHKKQTTDTQPPRPAAGKGPVGRPWTNVRALARQHSEEALNELVKLMYDPNKCVAVAAQRAVLDRANGKVPARLKHVGKRRKPKPPEPRKPTVKITWFGKGNPDAG